MNEILGEAASYSCTHPSSEINEVLFGLTQCLAQDLSKGTAFCSEGKRYGLIYPPF